MAGQSTYKYVRDRPPLVVAILIAFLIGVGTVPGMVSRSFLGPENAVKTARIMAHSMFPKAVQTTLIGLGQSPSDRQTVEEFLRHGRLYHPIPYDDFHGEWEVGVHREDVIPVSVFYYQERGNSLSALRPYGYGLACVEYRIGEEWEVIDVPCGWEAMNDLRARNASARRQRQ